MAEPPGSADGDQETVTEPSPGRAATDVGGGRPRDNGGGVGRRRRDTGGDTRDGPGRDRVGGRGGEPGAGLVGGGHREGVAGAVDEAADGRGGGRGDDGDRPRRTRAG